MLADLRKILRLLDSRQKRQAIGVFILMLVGMVIETLGVGVVIPVLGLLSGNMPDNEQSLVMQGLRLLAGQSANSTEIIATAMIAMAVLFVLKAAFLAVMYWVQFGFVYQLQADLSWRMFRKYLSDPIAFHARRNSANLIRNVNQEVHLFTQGALMAGFIFMTEFLVALGIVSLLLITEPFGALIVVFVMGGAALGFLKLTRARLTAWGKLRQEMDGKKIQYVQQGLGGIKDVKVLGREATFLSTFDGPNRAIAQVGTKQNFVGALPRLWLELLAVIGLVVLVLVMLSQGRQPSELAPILGLFAAAAFRLLPSANRLVGAAQNIRFNRVAIDVLDQELGEVTETKILKSNETPMSFRERIEVSALEFSYEAEETPSLQNISFDIRKGDSVGIVGASGAGKSTLVDLILGILTPQGGQITVDGQDIRDNLRSFQNLIGYVPQDIYLTDSSLRDNIAFGLDPEDVDEDAIARAISAAQLSSVVAEAEHGLDTVVGERGIKLSGGQRQRIGIARALYHNPSILVLDEATSALDTATEKSVMAAIDAMKGDKTMIIITHRLSTLENADKIIELEKGRIKSTDHLSG
ncbi:ABC transporter ATP-binding protein [Pontivivens insulae]|uniref:Lipid A export ATP-binding/permease protein MsbA n=1 Tax=Pontivivens insulae TaxID=1639689 RepID=A0A2R8A7K8_9RHOB|nr:ABC transporter ATP-binding protein [Pontivivens insulae]RED18278.1 ABC-type bacteriocin/lantibiotic exporter with double-glycine peptidase domain [Pontivivens insulae]SPF28176.1 Lipid A export ATP-binding/permease protein MsbA [Pontivivens insulae]